MRGRKVEPESWSAIAVEVAVFSYLWQNAAFVHIACHFVVARLLGIDAELHLAWQKLVPLYGWLWDKWNPHTAFMCEYNLRQIRDAEAWKRASIGFSGQYGATLYMLLVGLCFPKILEAVGGYRTYTIAVLSWTLVYLFWYSVWFHEDSTGDFALMTRVAA